MYCHFTLNNCFCQYAILKSLINSLQYITEVSVMKIKLLIATDDSDYGEHLSNFLSERQSTAFDVNFCSSIEHFQNIIVSNKFDAALMEPIFAAQTDLSNISLPLILWSHDEKDTDVPDNFTKVHKYQRISSLTEDVLESYAKASNGSFAPFGTHAKVTACWSPKGGAGTSSVALAYCAEKARTGKDVLYLSLESFSSIPVFFADSGKSISTIFDVLEKKEGDISILINGLRRKDDKSSISYFCSPKNYDDVNILSIDDIQTLISACCAVTDELVIDMSCICNKRVWQVFQQADNVFLVTDNCMSAMRKLNQFVAQHNIFQQIKPKITLVANKNSPTPELFANSAISLPYINSDDCTAVYMALSDYISPHLTY